jgi:ribosomal protein S18 acetylase RimI-like enzyme
MALTIRATTATDLPAIEGIESLAFRTDRLSRRSLRRLVGRPSAVVLSAEADGAVVGYALVLLHRGRPQARLYSLARVPDLAPPGTGRRLLAAAEACAKARGCQEMRLEVRTDNSSALRLYEEQGYRIFGRRAHYYEDGADALRMRKPL